MPKLEPVKGEPPRAEPIIVLDARPLGIFSNPKATPENELARFGSATTNVRHLAPFANARQWQDVR